MEYFANPIKKRKTLLLKGKIIFTVTLFLTVGTESYCGVGRNRNAESARQALMLISAKVRRGKCARHGKSW